MACAITTGLSTYASTQENSEHMSEHMSVHASKEMSAHRYESMEDSEALELIDWFCIL